MADEETVAAPPAETAAARERRIAAGDRRQGDRRKGRAPELDDHDTRGSGDAQPDDAKTVVEPRPALVKEEAPAPVEEEQPSAVSTSPTSATPKSERRSGLFW